MDKLEELLDRIEDIELRKELSDEIDRTKQYGLVFEKYFPSNTTKPGAEIKVGSRVAHKIGYLGNPNASYVVEKINGNMAILNTGVEYELDSLVPVATYDEQLDGAYFKRVDAIENAPGDTLWHSLIESENQIALRMLAKEYAGQVDCIYIDPPYNTGDTTWSYNNNFFSRDHEYRHSKWLSFMELRLKLAKELLNKDTGVLICTIDEKEFHRLRMLLEQVFPNFYIQTVVIVNNPKGSSRSKFSRVEEYAIYCFAPKANVAMGTDTMLGEVPKQTKKPRLQRLLRTGFGLDSSREENPWAFYPILYDEETGRIVRAGECVSPNEKVDHAAKIDGYSVIWPIRSDGSEGRWMLMPETFNEWIDKGYIIIKSYDKDRHTGRIDYYTRSMQKQIETGMLKVVGHTPNGQGLVTEYENTRPVSIKSVWHRKRHDAGTYGTKFLSKLLCGQYFTYPKSLYAVKDCIAPVVSKDALILDFFAGSGTTLHAVNLLNAEDGGKRRCIMVTNNEVSLDDRVDLGYNGYVPGDYEYEACGVARRVAWPRTVCSIKGVDARGNALDGEYLSGIPMADGFKANCAYYRLSYND